VCRTNVRVQIEPEPQCEKNLGRVPLIRHTWVADGAEEDRVEFLSQHFKRPGRERDTFPQIFLRTPIELYEFQTGSEYFVDTSQDAHGFAGHINADTIARDNCNTFHVF